MATSILHHVTERDVIADPFPHVLLDAALPEDLCDQLIAEFPATEVVTKGAPAGTNQRFDYTVSDVRSLGGVSLAWREFMEANAGEDFLKDFARVFAPHLRRLYPSLNLGNVRPGVRYIDDYAKADILLDAHISLNTPVVGEPSSVRTAHVDDPRKLYGGLLYLRKPNDDSKGGNLVLYRYQKGIRPVYVGQQIAERYVAEVATVPYQRNTFILFLNSFDSIHGVTPRFPTPHPRTFVNFVGQLEQPLFDIQSYQERGLSKLIKRLQRAMHLTP